MSPAKLGELAVIPPNIPTAPASEPRATLPACTCALAVTPRRVTARTTIWLLVDRGCPAHRGDPS
jgi:hypothetical protein